ncbi:neurotrophin 1 [Battus philenor]|uniref:neurotrophin 1 n=1 Tax=Battus philenor TaxID=42288 RepID=UPI0035D06567
MAYISRIVLILAAASAVRVQDEDFEFSDPHEVMIAQESRSYHTFAAPPVRIIKPNGVINSHRPQYNLDSLEEDLANIDVQNVYEATTRKSLYQTYNHHNLRNKEVLIRDAVLRALERKDHVGKFAQVLPIVRAMTGSQRVALASLVASQVSTPPGRSPLNLSQVRSMFGNENNSTSDLMLPILLDMANLIRRAVRPGKEPREVKMPPTLPQNQFSKRSFIEDSSHSGEFDPGVEEFKPVKTTTTKSPFILKNRNTRIRPQRTLPTDKTNKDNTADIEEIVDMDFFVNSLITAKPTPTTTEQPQKARSRSMTLTDNSTMDLTADSTNQSLHELPIPERLRSFNRFIDRKGNVIRRGSYNPKPLVPRRTTAETPPSNIISRRRPFPSRKPPPPSEQANCELFTNTVCLHTEDYPTEAIIQTIRRNKAAAGALLADFKDPGEGAVDGITAAQEAKYTADHYLVSNRRGDTANRDFASAGEAGFMCPSTVKYARPQRARATSGQWKYIVNTGEHTQTLRLEKCLKPKESCTYLTDNFKSKCVQVYNYHRLLTWDQQNGLHMDIFKVPTCCSCHIEGYSVSFPPLGQRVHESSSEHFPGEDLSSDQGNQAFEDIQSTVHKPSLNKLPNFSYKRPLDTLSSFSDNHNTIPGPLFSEAVSDDDDFNNTPPPNLKDSYGNSYYPDSINLPNTIKSVRKPSIARNPLVTSFNTATLPSYLEPPTPSGSSYSYSKETSTKYKNSDNIFKRGISRQHRRPIRKKTSGTTDDLLSSGTSAVGAFSDDSIETEEDPTTDVHSGDTMKTNSNMNGRVTIAPKLYALSTGRPFNRNQEQIIKEEMNSNSKRINYNYHPIIDFFGEDEREGNESIDRGDSVRELTQSAESEWKPINHPDSRK